MVRALHDNSGQANDMHEEEQQKEEDKREAGKEQEDVNKLVWFLS